jgi:hypothetical protein
MRGCVTRPKQDYYSSPGAFAIAGAWHALTVALPLLLVLSALRIWLEACGLARAVPESFAAYRRSVRF